MGRWRGDAAKERSRTRQQHSRRYTHTHAHTHTYCASLSTHTLWHSATDSPSRLHPVLQSASVPVPPPVSLRNRNHCVSRAEASPPPPRGPEDPAEAASSGDGGRTHTHMSRHSTQAKSRTASCEYKSVGEAGNARQGIRSASSDGKTMISMATHDTRSESDGRSAFGSPGAEAAPASDSTGGGPITLNVFPNRAAGPCAGLFYVVMRLDGAPSTGNGQIPAGQRADRGYLETTSRGDARRPEGRRRC